MYLSNILKGYDISYGVYIYHMVIINVVIHFGFFKGWPAVFISFLLTTLLALFSWIIIEKPALRLKKSTIRKMNNYFKFRQ